MKNKYLNHMAPKRKVKVDDMPKPKMVVNKPEGYYRMGVKPSREVLTVRRRK